jgi:nickel/cobalt exporter
MPDLVAILQSGAGNPWVYLPVALVLGALHALEPGHSKSIMAAFIVAVRGTPWQATVLGVSAAVGHTLVIWALALAGLYLGDKLILDKAEPWLVLATGVLIVLIAARILYRLIHPRHLHGHEHPRGHDEANDHRHHPGEDARPNHDSHSAAHAAQLRNQLCRRPVTTWDISWFGFTAGLLPCPAALAVLLVCLQLRQMALGLVMVAAFSMGLAVSLVAIGVAAATGARAAERRLPLFSRWADRLPYASAGVVLLFGVLVFGRGLSELGLL